MSTIVLSRYAFAVLIETLWNVNVLTVQFLHSLQSINRNIVECKFISFTSSAGTSPTVLIETLWNVNFWTPVVSILVSIVLIETLWNVNKTQILLQELSALVLIETLWNVNFIAQTFIDTCGYVLIETLWNVNFHNAHCFLQ